MKALTNSYNRSVPSDILLKYIALYKRLGNYSIDIDTLNNDYSVYHELTRKKDISALYNAYFKEHKISDQRFQNIISESKHVTPRNNDERYLSNITEIFNLIYSDRVFNLTFNEIINLEKVLSQDIKGELTGLKRPLKDERSYKDRLSEVCDEYNKLYQEGKVESMILNISFLIDFLKLSPFYSNNELVGMIIVYILFLKTDLNCFAYVSFFEYFLNNKELFNEALLKAYFMYDEGMSDSSLLSRFFLDLSINSYEELHTLAKVYKREKVVRKTSSVESVIYKLDETFSKEDIRKVLPNVSDSTIDRVLKKMCDEGKISPLGRGRGAKWLRIDDSYLESENLFKNF
ncbi:MAG: hypothetical protein K6G38_03100 [Gammaproteobacteria bacterium]|nr:hypothetical protein [Gammaproteobacteria bacterium]